MCVWTVCFVAHVTAFSLPFKSLFFFYGDAGLVRVTVKYRQSILVFLPSASFQLVYLEFAQHWLRDFADNYCKYINLYSALADTEYFCVSIPRMFTISKRISTILVAQEFTCQEIPPPSLPYTLHHPLWPFITPASLYIQVSVMGVKTSVLLLLLSLVDKSH